VLVPICCDFDPVEFVLEYTRLVFLPESQLDPNNPSPHPAVFGGVFGSVLLLSGVEGIVSNSFVVMFVYVVTTNLNCSKNCLRVETMA